LQKGSGFRRKNERDAPVAPVFEEPEPNFNWLGRLSHHLGAQSGVGKDFLQQGVRHPPVDEVHLADAPLKGVQSGIWKEYNYQGILQAVGEYVQGQKSGKWKIFDAKGKLQKKVVYEGGEPKE
jgi:hypothetical protein